MSRLSLAQQLAELSEAAPVDLDPEDVQAGVYPEDESAIDNTTAREHYVDVAPSAIRKLHESVSDPKYEGVRTSRKQLFEDIDGEAESKHEGSSLHGSVPSQSEDEDESESQKGEEEGEDEDASESSQSDHEDGFEQDSAPSGQEDAPQLNGQPGHSENEHQYNDDLASTLRKTRDEDRQKGKAVARQIALWDTLLDTRIQLQKVVTAANRLPNGTYLQNLASHRNAREALDIMFGEAAALSEELFSLQEDLLQHNESVTAPPRKRRKVGHEQEASRDNADLLRDLSTDASALEASYHGHLVQTLAKWSAKVQAVAPSVLIGNRTSFNKDDRSKVGVVGMVDDILRTDRDKLLSRTRISRSKNKRLGSGDRPSEAHVGDSDEKEDPEVFDDLDFYQQLLRDVIKARGGDTAGGEQDWMAQQRDRKAKRKLKLDTKASKGRKLRYEVHAKLQNFMVPVPVVHGAWHEEQIDGLFSSLLGAG